jgi:hypothetical protein
MQNWRFIAVRTPMDTASSAARTITGALNTQSLRPLWHARRSAAGLCRSCEDNYSAKPEATHKLLKGMRRREHSEWTCSQRGSHHESRSTP